MYASLTWNINPASNVAADINSKIARAFGTHARTALLATTVIIRLDTVQDFFDLGEALEAIYDAHRTDFAYVLFQQEARGNMLPVERPTWDQALVNQIRA